MQTIYRAVPTIAWKSNQRVLECVPVASWHLAGPPSTKCSGLVFIICAHREDSHHFSCRHPLLQNYPLYIRSVPTENELKFHYMVHTSLDVVDEKISAMGKALVDQRELYLGLLYPTEDYKVYPYSGQGPGSRPTGRESGIPPEVVWCTVGSDNLERHFVPSLEKKKR